MNHLLWIYMYQSIIKDKGHNNSGRDNLFESNVPVCVLPRCFFKHSIFLSLVVRARVNRARTCVSKRTCLLLLLLSEHVSCAGIMSCSLFGFLLYCHFHSFGSLAEQKGRRLVCFGYITERSNVDAANHP